MPQLQSDVLLDTACRLITEDGFDAVSISRIASELGLDDDDVLAEFGSLEDLLVAMLNREFGGMWAVIIDNIDRDPRGGFLSQIYRYTLTAVYERPLARALYLMDRDGLNTIMRATHGFSYIPEFRLRASFIERMQDVGMVRRDVDPHQLSALLSAVSAGAALTAPNSELDLVSEGLLVLLERGADTDATDTSPGKAAYVEFAMSLVNRKDPT
ncbi:MAG: helix-turn-helix domain-containing protein [Pseudolysinimonas sp.]|uniref:TetR/AcrR family transcriptional regulator n=1 Tax=Pseudolysinimonas sp. TaxID=2680009 RepID=UPI003264701E